MTGPVLVLAGGAVGVVSWGHSAWLMPVALLLPWLWGRAQTRRTAAAVALAYYALASRGLPAGAAAYFDAALLHGVGLWLLACSVLAASWALAWHPQPQSRQRRCALLLVLLAVPPLGIVGWVHPLTGVGILLPGSGWIGLLLAAASLVLLADGQVRPAPLLAGLAGLMLISQLRGSGLPVSDDWTDTRRSDPYTAHEDLVRDYHRQRALQQQLQQLAGGGAQVVVLAESAAGPWLSGTARLWQQAAGPLPGVVLLGAEVSNRDGGRDNVMLQLRDGQAEVRYRQRQPVPLTMWRPWSGQDGTAAYWFENPVVEVAGQAVAVLICYEQLLMWPVLHSVAAGAQRLVGQSNLWWAAGTSIPAIQAHSLQSWSRLFWLPLNRGVNL